MRQRQSYKSPPIKTDGRTLFDIRPSEEKDSWSAELVKAGLDMDDVEIRDAAVQAADDKSHDDSNKIVHLKPE